MSRFSDALNGQIAYEFGASQQYVAIAVYYDAETLPGLAAHFYRQAVEERNHAMIMVQYLLDAGEAVVTPGVEAPQTAFGDPVSPVALALDQERRVTDQISALTALAREESDFIARAVPRLVPQGAARGGLEHVVAARRGRARRRDEHPVRRGASRAHRGRHSGPELDAPPAAGGAL